MKKRGSLLIIAIITVPIIFLISMFITSTYITIAKSVKKDSSNIQAQILKDNGLTDMAKNQAKWFKHLR